MHSLVVGFGLGFLVALQLGPMSLFLIRSTLRGGWAVGLAIGAGIAVVDLLYAAAGAAGAAPLLTIGPLRVILGLVGATVLIVLGLRTLHSALRVRQGLEVAEEIADPRRAFLTSLGGTASNPLTIASWAAVFAAASVAGAAGTTGGGGAARGRRRARARSRGWPRWRPGSRWRGGRPASGRSGRRTRSPGSGCSDSAACSPTARSSRD